MLTLTCFNRQKCAIIEKKIKEHLRIQIYLFPRMPRGGDGRVGSPKPFSVFGVGGGGGQKSPHRTLSLYIRA